MRIATDTMSNATGVNVSCEEGALDAHAYRRGTAVDSKRDNHLHDTPCGEPASQCLARRIASAASMAGVDRGRGSMGLASVERVSMDCVCTQSPEVEKRSSRLDALELIIRYREVHNLRFSEVVLELEANHGIVMTANAALGRYYRHCNRTGKTPHDTGRGIKSRRS